MCTLRAVSLSLKKRKSFHITKDYDHLGELSYVCSFQMHFALLQASFYVNSQISSIYFWLIKAWVSLQMRMFESWRWLNVVTFKIFLFLSVALYRSHFILLGSRDSNWGQHGMQLRILALKSDYLGSTLIILLPFVWCWDKSLNLRFSFLICEKGTIIIVPKFHKVVLRNKLVH